MAYTPRTLDQIRDRFLTTWATNYTAIGETLLTTDGSDAWMTASALALTLLALEYQAAVLQDQILPDRAQEGFLERHGAVEGLPRRRATLAQLTVDVTGTPSASVTITGRAMTTAAGLRFACLGTTCTLDGSGNGTVDVVATTAGTTGNLATGTLLTWVAAPAGFDATGTVLGFSSGVIAEDDELSSAYAARVIAYRQRRPGSGNREDWIGWGEAVDGVDVVFAYPNVSLARNRTGVPGALTLVALGPAQGASADRTRIVGSGVLAALAGYVEGTNDVHGVAVPTASQIQLRPAAMQNYEWIAATPEVLDVTLLIEPAAGSEFSWEGTPGYSVVAGTSTTAFSVSPAPIGVPVAERPAVGDTIAVQFPASGSGSVRGGYALTTIVTVNASSGAITCDPPLPFTPAAFALVLPAAPFWSSVRDAIFAIFDGLGPGDTLSGIIAIPFVATRWPTEDVAYRASIHKVRLAAAALGATGVVNVEVSLPTENTATPGPFGILTLRNLRMEAL